ncbi:MULTISPECIES: hypothetical protein [Paenibacillus]|jgi:hypothetical protein|uniref:hypothetical protein n=1 Tax=Paenibacillus TaxID=44249 RepID=UPI00240CFA16|nr:MULTISPECIES: hypothetical protein [Paenibacillus]MCI1777700.1 hypothetical protein [Paenibacillus lautus]WFB57638.1 hypothetical protein P0X86_27335 [Paenibacillus sp. BR1-192]
MAKLPKLPKAHAERALKTLIGSAAGMAEMSNGRGYVVLRGTLFVEVYLEDMWPSGVFIRGDIYFQGVVIKTVYLNRDTFEPDLVITEQAERIKARERRADH